LHQELPKNTVVIYAEDYPKLALSTVDITMRRPPTGNEDILFYPGQIFKTDRVTQATQVPLQSFMNTSLWSVDRLSSIKPASSSGTYRVTVGSSNATIDDLRAAGIQYPGWLQPFMSLPGGGRYRSPAALSGIRDLALKTVREANAVTPYDQATAIENFLRSSTFTYTLQPPPTPEGQDPIDYFLRTSHKGYCEYFATAMGDMLRSLGIPTRLVNGYGPGTYDASINGYYVRGEDAHTWVEVYFPTYGWIPFEPTKDTDNVYQSIQRASSGSSTGCFRENGCDATAASDGSSAPPVAAPKNPRETDPGNLPGGFSVRIPDAGTLTTVLAVLLAVLLLLFAGIARYLRPRTVMGVWSRTLTLARFAGADPHPGETPRETSQRLRSSFPEASEPVDSLAKGFAVAAYAPPEEASTTKSSVMEAWSALRPMLLRRVLSRLKPL
jgi:hypothetical protein